jgi:hypothetical protein
MTQHPMTRLEENRTPREKVTKALVRHRVSAATRCDCLLHAGRYTWVHSCASTFTTRRLAAFRAVTIMSTYSARRTASTQEIARHEAPAIRVASAAIARSNIRADRSRRRRKTRCPALMCGVDCFTNTVAGVASCWCVCPDSAARDL